MVTKVCIKVKSTTLLETVESPLHHNGGATLPVPGASADEVSGAGLGAAFVRSRSG